MLNKCKYKNTKHMHIRHPKQHVSKQSCSNTQLSSKDGYKKKKEKEKKNVLQKHKYGINVRMRYKSFTFIGWDSLIYSFSVSAVSEQICPSDTLACCWDIQHTTNNSFHLKELDNIKEWTGLEWNIILRKSKNGEEWRKLVVKSTVVPHRSARLRDRWEMRCE